MGADPQLESERVRLQQHIRKSVGIAVLRKIGGLVDEYEAEKRLARRMMPIGIALLCMAVIGVLLSLYVFRFAPSERPAPQFASKKDALPDSAPRALRLDLGERTQDHVLAAYSEKFRSRVENVGAQQFMKSGGKRISGSVTLSTHIRTDDGTVARIEVAKPSGDNALDDLAQKIVMIASPFPPIPDELKQKTQTLVITRQFTFTKE